MNDGDLEFSEYGRDPLYPHGWWILPAAVAGSVVYCVVLWWWLI